MTHGVSENYFAWRLGAAWAAAWCVWNAASGVALTLLALAAGALQGWHAPFACGLSACFAVCGAWCVWRTLSPDELKGSRSWKAPWLETLMGALFFVALFRAFFWVAYEDGDTIKIENSSNLGDLALHLTFIRHLAGPGVVWPESPIISGELLAYPLGMDLINAALLKSGIPWLPGLIVVGFLGGLATLGALRLWGGWFVVVGFLFNGGLSFFDFLGTGDLPALEWKNIFACMLVPQRGFLFAFPAGFLLMSEARARMGGRSFLPNWASLLILASIPLFHIHTAMFLGGLCAFWALTARGFRRTAMTALALSALPWLVWIFLVTGSFSTHGAIRWAPGWMENGEGLRFWLRNFGIYPLLVLAAAATALFQRRGYPVWDRLGARTVQHFLIPSVICFTATCLIGFAPWLWDNTKLMVWSYLASLPFVGALLRRGLPTAAGVGLTVLIFLSGAQTFWERVVRRGPAGFELAVRLELFEIEKMTQTLNEKGRFAAAPTFDHPLLLVGQPVALGYLGHLWSHGYDYAQRLEHLEQLMNGREGWQESASILAVRYLFWGLREVEAYPNTSKPWSNRKILESPWGNIYDLGPPLPAKETR